VLGVNTGKGRFVTVLMNGINIKTYTNKVAVRESVCSHYLTAELTFFDTVNIIEKMGLKCDGTDWVLIHFDAVIKGQKIKSEYKQIYNVISYKQVDGGPESVRTKVYEISLVGPEYFVDRSTLVVESVKHITGCALSSKIWKESGFPSALSIPVTDTMITEGDEPYQINYMKPFTAIAQIRNQMYYPTFPTGNALLYRDYYSEVLAPLQYLMDTKSAQETFVEKETWGTSWRDIFETEHAIINAAAQTRSQSGAGGTAKTVGSAAGPQGNRAFDAVAGKFSFNKFMASGAPTLHMNNSNRVNPMMDFTQKTATERLYAAKCKGGPQWNIRVPLQLGINLTVGKGVHCDLLPVAGDQKNFRQSKYGGLMLVTDIVHEVWAENKPVTGTTTFQAIKGMA